MKTQNYTTHITPSSPFSAQNLAKTYLSRKIPLSLNITEANFEEAAEAIYDLCHGAGDQLRGGKGRAGGGREDIRVALAIAGGIEIDVDFWAENARKFKNSLSVKLQKAWKDDDVDTLVSVFCGIERNAATAFVNHRDSDGLVEDLDAFYEIDLNEAEEMEVEEEPEIDMVEVLIMSQNTVQRRKYGGNEFKPRSKLTTRASKQLVQLVMEL